jgi:hypothetical protein
LDHVYTHLHSPEKHLLASGICLSVPLSTCISMAPIVQISVKSDIADFMKICSGILTLIKIRRKYQALHMKHKYVLMLPVTLTATKVISSSKMDSVCYESRDGTNMT